MDPNATLRAIRVHLAAEEPEPGSLAELVEALDEWITRGGFLPSDWHR